MNASTDTSLRRLRAEARRLILLFRIPLLFVAIGVSALAMLALSTTTQQVPQLVYRLLELHVAAIVLMALWGREVMRFSGAMPVALLCVPDRSRAVQQRRALAGLLVAMTIWIVSVGVLQVTLPPPAVLDTSLTLRCTLAVRMGCALVTVYALAALLATRLRHPLRWMSILFTLVALGVPMAYRLSTGSFNLVQIRWYAPFTLELQLLAEMLGPTPQSLTAASAETANWWTAPMWAAVSWLALRASIRRSSRAS